MRTIRLFALSTQYLKMRLAPSNTYKPSSKIALVTVPMRCFFCISFMLFVFNICHAVLSFPYGPRREKTCLRGSSQSEIQTSLLS